MIIRHRAGGEDWAGVEVSDNPGLLVGALPGVKERDYGVCAHLVIMGIREEQNRVVANAKRMAGPASSEEEKVDAIHKALSGYKVGCTYKPKPNALIEALKTLKEAGVTPEQIVMAATQDLTEDARAVIKARLLK